MGNTSLSVKNVVEKYNKHGKIVPLKHEEIASIFKKYDANQNNKLEHHEAIQFLNDVIRAVRPNDDQETIEEMSNDIFKEIDVNHSGTIEIDVCFCRVLNRGKTYNIFKGI